MNLNYTFEVLNLEENKLILSSKKIESREILFTELDSIYISVNKFPSFSECVPLLFSIVIIASFLLYLSLDLILFLPPLIIIVSIAKMTSYKSYELKIRLKNGTCLKKQVPLKLKHETIDIVNEVRKEIYNYKINS
ncbi:hypothetical protein H4V97_001070 [Flavobacterium sp. CG_23.5]|uniref:hypothetical protein n=1 Tax=unclassified Flavobacterium TaxID=196869 RepID=UPI0018C9FB72|nr:MULTISPECIES: hypothetical protein [unclassified Flavobacterium]MBG6112048.1 hypothetical protein [Flavobacterium sp. CG_9.10]MBP2282752.1 hypothetical protein [Flavobacterium sp. CG_23.5]